MLKFGPDHLKTINMCKHAVKILPYLQRYIPDQHKTQQICDKLFYKMVEHQSLFLNPTKIKKCVIKQ